MHLWAGAELGRRLEHTGAIPLGDLIALYRAAMRAGRIAEEIGLEGQARAQLLDYAKERSRARPAAEPRVR